MSASFVAYLVASFRLLVLAERVERSMIHFQLHCIFGGSGELATGNYCNIVSYFFAVPYHIWWQRSDCRWDSLPTLFAYLVAAVGLEVGYKRFCMYSQNSLVVLSKKNLIDAKYIF